MTTTDAWTGFSTKQRCRVLGDIASFIVDDVDQLVAMSASDQRTDPVETIASELLPLCSALRFVRRQGHKILKDRTYGAAGRPAWLWGVKSHVRRRPFGQVLILGTWNYPLLLPGVQAAQALAAGNSVLLKPAVGAESVTQRMVDHFVAAGVPPRRLQLLDSSTEAAIQAMDDGVDLIALTGSAATGRKVLAKAAETLTPTIVELSGCDAVVVLPGADHQRVAAAIDFGLNFNGGATCIGPRRLILAADGDESVVEPVRQRLLAARTAIIHPAARDAVADAAQDAIDNGAVDLIGGFDANAIRQTGKMKPLLLDNVDANSNIANADVFAPLISILRANDKQEAIQFVNRCHYRLAASVFGPASEAQRIASQLDVGTAVVNDLIVPTADPRLPFGGRGHSGFGPTRGVEGLLAMTVPTVLSQRRGRFLPHLDERQESDANRLKGLLQLFYAGSWRKKLGAMRLVASTKKPADHDAS